MRQLTNKEITIVSGGVYQDQDTVSEQPETSPVYSFIVNFLNSVFGWNLPTKILWTGATAK